MQGDLVVEYHSASTKVLSRFLLTVEASPNFYLETQVSNSITISCHGSQGFQEKLTGFNG